MIRVGDKVRYKNKYLAAHMVLAPGRRRNRHYRSRRGEQKIMTVTHISRGNYCWKTKRYSGDLVKTDQSEPWRWINTYWLSFVRRDT